MRPIRPALIDGQLTLAATHVLMSTAAWQLPANAGEQVLPVGTGPQRFLPYLIIKRNFPAKTAGRGKIYFCREVDRIRTPRGSGRLIFVANPFDIRD